MAASIAGPERRQRGVSFAWLGRVLLLAAITLAGYLLYRTLSRYDPGELAASVLSVPLLHLAAAIGWAAASYVCLTGFDWLGLSYVGHRLPYPKVALTSFVSLSLGHNIGFAGLSSGAIRYRYYAREGLSAAEVAKLVVFCGTTVALGLVTLAGIALLARPGEAEAMLRLGRPALLAIGGACVLVPVLYVAMACVVRRPLCLYRWSFALPGVRLALGQIALGTLNFAFVAACLDQVLSAAFEVPYLATASAFVLANAAGLLTHVPGGLGVIESVVVYLIPREGVLPYVLVFRFAYFLLPLALGGALFAATELWRGGRRLSR